jgi:hypothetical protein
LFCYIQVFPEVEEPPEVDALQPCKDVLFESDPTQLNSAKKKLLRFVVSSGDPKVLGSTLESDFLDQVALLKEVPVGSDVAQHSRETAKAFRKYLMKYVQRGQAHLDVDKKVKGLRTFFVMALVLRGIATITPNRQTRDALLAERNSVIGKLQNEIASRGQEYVNYERVKADEAASSVTLDDHQREVNRELRRLNRPANAENPHFESPELSQITQAPANVSRHRGSIITDVYQYIEKNELYATNKQGQRVVKPDKHLKNVLGKNNVRLHEVPKLLSRHMTKSSESRGDPPKQSIITRANSAKVVALCE